MKNNLENQDIKTDKPVPMSYEALKADRDAQQKRADALAVENAEIKQAFKKVAKTVEECELYGDVKYVVDPSEYESLSDAIEETPATDAALAAIEARGVEKLIKLKMEQLASMHPDTYAFGATAESLRAQINELQAFAAELREAK
ncbi:TPA: hypothetical protein ACGD7R_002981 [Serratia marcescens]